MSRFLRPNECLSEQGFRDFGVRGSGFGVLGVRVLGFKVWGV